MAARATEGMSKGRTSIPRPGCGLETPQEAAGKTLEREERASRLHDQPRKV